MLKRKHEGRKASLRPPKDNFLHPKHRSQLKIMRRCQRFSEDVCNLLLYRNVLQDERTILNQLPDEVHVDFNVLCLLMLHWVARNVNGTLIVTPKNSGTI